MQHYQFKEEYHPDIQIIERSKSRRRNKEDKRDRFLAVLNEGTTEVDMTSNGKETDDDYVIEAKKLAKKVIWRRPKVSKPDPRIEEAPSEIKHELNWVRELETKKDPLENFKIVKVFPRKIYLRQREELT
jgi:hypothetical protein